uniref:Uncharacterized protein n=1 Tax=Anguilla anguilla TaxID=7936 RepID=A0A0E9SFW9_ANGAN
MGPVTASGSSHCTGLKNNFKQLAPLVRSGFQVYCDTNLLPSTA